MSSTIVTADGLFAFLTAEAVVARIDETVKEYSRQFDALMFMLKEQVRALCLYGASSAA
jgi:hypothetical protein